MVDGSSRYDGQKHATANETVTKPTMGQVAATTLEVYGVIFVVFFLLYVWLVKT